MSILPNHAFSAELPKISKTLCQNQSYIDEIHWLWKKRKPAYEKWIINSDKTPYNLYNIQGETNNLLKYAAICEDKYILDELISLYLGALETLDEAIPNLFHSFKIPEGMSNLLSDQKHKMWLDENKILGNESILVSSQFLALISEVINIISKIDYSDRSSEMNRFINEYYLLVMDHYTRWVLREAGPFQVRGWGCKVKFKYVKIGMSHKEFIEKKKNHELGDKRSPSYCNAVTDTDLWIFAGVSNILAASKNDQKITISQKNYEGLYEHLKIGLELIASRITKSNLTDFEGSLTIGVNFDLGVWDDYHTHEYASNSTAMIYDINKLNKKRPGKNVGWDLSHARRFVHVFDSFYRNKKILSLNFPSKKIMKGISNQLVYRVFNKNFELPLFRNFMDGTNGWYRVGYSGRKGFGYAPWDMSIAVVTGGYGFWSVYNKDIEVLFNAIVEMLNSDEPSIRHYIQEHYEKNFWQNHERKRRGDFKDTSNIYTQKMLIQMLPSMCFHSNESKLPSNN